MLKRIKNLASVLMIGATLGATAVSAPDADAGLILAPIGIGIILIIDGVADQSLGLVILSNTDGTLKQDSLTADLMNKYRNLGIDTQTAADISTLVNRKYQSAQADPDGKITVSFSKDELSTGLQATNIESDNPALFNQLVTDMKPT